MILACIKQSVMSLNKPVEAVLMLRIQAHSDGKEAAGVDPQLLTDRYSDRVSGAADFVKP